MKQKLILLLFLLPALLAGQNRMKLYRQGVKAQREVIETKAEEAGSPSLYESLFDQYAEEGAEAIRRGYDIVLDPIERVNFSASYADVQAGSWGEDRLGINRRYKDIYDRATRKVAVFIFDTGAFADVHAALKPLSWPEKDRMYTGEADNEDKHSHSTHCAGIVAGADGQGLDPVAEKGLMRLISYKVLSNSGSGMFSWIEAGIRDANEEAAKLIADGWFVVYSFSLGGGTAKIPSIEEAFKEAQDAGVYVVAAAGNTGREGVNYPGNSEYTVAVAALQQSADGVSRAGYSTFGDGLNIAEPGSSILSTIPGNAYAFKSGTSMATPHQARLAAMVASVYPNLDAYGVRAHLKKYAVDLPPAGWDMYTGDGWNVVDGLLDNKPGDNPPPPPPDPDPDPNPDPPTDPEPPKPDKPVRVFTSGFPRLNAAYTVRWKEHGAEQMEVLSFRITVAAKFREDAADFAKRINKATDDHFRSRSYFLTRGSDYWDAAFWVSFFYEKILAAEDLDVEVLEIEAYNPDGYAVILTEKDLKKQRGLSRLFLNARFFETKQIN